MSSFSTMQSSGAQFYDFPSRRRGTVTDLPQTPALPAGSASADSFGAAGSGSTSAIAEKRAAFEPVKGFLMLVGFLVAVRLLYELAEDVTD